MTGAKKKGRPSCEAAQYMMLGAGEGYTVVSPPRRRERYVDKPVRYSH